MSTGWSPVFWTDFLAPQWRDAGALMHAAGGLVNYPLGNVQPYVAAARRYGVTG